MITLQSPQLYLTIDIDGSMYLNLKSKGGDISSMKRVADGKWGPSDATWLFPDACPELPLNWGALLTTAIAQSGPNIAQIIHSYTNVSIVTTITLVGEDISFKSIITNLHTLATIGTVNFSGLTFHFSRQPDALLNSRHDTYITSHPSNEIFSPSAGQVIPAAYAADGSFGFGLSTGSHLAKPMYMQAAWGGAEDVVAKDCNLQFMPKLDIEPGASKAVTWTIRVSTNTSKFYLLANFKLAMLNAFPSGPLYTINHLPMLFGVSIDASHITPDNPYGYNGLRMDQSASVTQFINEKINKVAGICQGYIKWISYLNKRGADYRPDFDVFPADVEPQVIQMAAGCQAAGVRFGVGSRPGELIWQTNPNTDGWAPLDTAQLPYLQSRFAKMDAVGTTDFYMDSFATNTKHHEILRYLRWHVTNRNTHFWLEQGTAISAYYAGRYAETNADGSLTYLPANVLEILRWVFPQMVVLVKDAGNIGLEAIYARHLTPLVEDAQIGMNPGIVNQLKALNAKYLNAQNQWK